MPVDSSDEADGLMAEKEGIGPVPLVGNGNKLLLLDQVKVVPGVVDSKLMGAVVVPLQWNTLDSEFINGVGKTVMVNCIGALTQFPLLDEAMKVTLALIGAVPVFTAVNDGINPIPLPVLANPMAGLSQVQVYG